MDVSVLMGIARWFGGNEKGSYMPMGIDTSPRESSCPSSCKLPQQLPLMQPATHKPDTYTHFLSERKAQYEEHIKTHRKILALACDIVSILLLNICYDDSRLIMNFMDLRTQSVAYKVRPVSGTLKASFT